MWAIVIYISIKYLDLKGLWVWSMILSEIMDIWEDH